MRKLRLGVVPYLNVLPLLEGLDEAFPRENRVFATPRELAALLAAREVDVATLPLYEALRAGSYSLVPGCAIGCDGPVRSVMLYAKRPVAEITTVLLDRGSLTSVHLAQVLFADLLRIAPACETSAEPLGAGFDFEASPYDAFVVIGDAALGLEGRFPHALDLGAAWKELTGLPFVFAAWTVRDGMQLSPQESAAFAAARRRGEERIDESARANSASPEDAARRAADFREAICYEFGPRQERAVAEFERRLRRLGLLEGTPAQSRGTQTVGA